MTFDISSSPRWYARCPRCMENNRLRMPDGVMICVRCWLSERAYSELSEFVDRTKAEMQVVIAMTLSYIRICTIKVEHKGSGTLFIPTEWEWDDDENIE